MWPWERTIWKNEAWENTAPPTPHGAGDDSAEPSQPAGALEIIE